MDIYESSITYRVTILTELCVEMRWEI